MIRVVKAAAVEAAVADRWRCSGVGGHLVAESGEELEAVGAHHGQLLHVPSQLRQHVRSHLRRRPDQMRYDEMAKREMR